MAIKPSANINSDNAGIELNDVMNPELENAEKNHSNSNQAMHDDLRDDADYPPEDDDVRPNSEASNNG